LTARHPAASIATEAPARRTAGESPRRGDAELTEYRTDQLDEVVALVRDVLPDATLGVYLHGSSVFGSLRPGSDLDLFVVTDRRTSDEERGRLIERLLPISGLGDPTGRSRSIGLEIVALPDVRPWRYPARLDFQFGDWFRQDFARGDLSPWDATNPDLAILLEMVRQADRSLFGPRPADLLDAIPWPDLRRAMLDSIPDLLSYLDGDERNVVLTFVRIWTTLATGVIRSKDGAAAWAMPLLPLEHRAVLAYARDNYLEGSPEAWGDLMPLVRPFVDHVIGEIERAAAFATRPAPT
jgi:predicted nucleotidyltransferase